MELNCAKFQSVIGDLESQGATVNVFAYINGGRRWGFEREIDYTIEAHWPSGRHWEIFRIDEE